MRQPGASAFFDGKVDEILLPAGFPAENLALLPDRYSYEGNWLFLTFDDSYVLGARLGFGAGEFDGRDYGLPFTPSQGRPLAYRIELLTPEGVHAHVFSDPRAGGAVEFASDRPYARFEQNGGTLFEVRGWPAMEWRFGSPDGRLSATLRVSISVVVLWPDHLMRHSTFSMWVASCTAEGVVRIADREFRVRGSGTLDHPRIVNEANGVPEFGWYLYAPLRFADGTQVAGYYMVDAPGAKNVPYSVGFLLRPGRPPLWLPRCDVRDLRLDGDQLPLSWRATLAGEGVGVSYEVHTRDLPLVEGDGSTASPKYLAYPILMAAEGECRVGGETMTLKRGSGFAEFLVRQGWRPPAWP